MPDPANQAVRHVVSDILSNFLSKYDWSGGPLARLRDQVYEEYKPNPVVHGLRGLLSSSSDIGLRSQHRYLFLEPVGETILPLLTLDTSNQWVHFRAYVLLTMLDQCSVLKTLAIRFETDEGVPQPNGLRGPHDFCHVQLCRYIDCRAPAITPNWLPDSQPSIPVDAEDQIGLVLCMLTSLYGGRHVVERLNTTGERDLRQHLQKVRALADRPGSEAGPDA